jgi:hypothetical protein
MNRAARLAGLVEWLSAFREPPSSQAYEKRVPRVSGDAVAQAVAHIPEIEETLKENIRGFWLPRCLDRVHGGYLMNID